MVILIAGYQAIRSVNGRQYPRAKMLRHVLNNLCRRSAELFADSYKSHRTRHRRSRRYRLPRITAARLVLPHHHRLSSLRRQQKPWAEISSKVDQVRNDLSLKPGSPRNQIDRPIAIRGRLI